MNKPFPSYEQQLKKLRKRGVNLPAGSSQARRAKKLLRRAGYYSIINGYKDIFLLYPSKSGIEDIYKPNTTFDSIYSLFTFDRNMRSIFMKNILITEGVIKSHISYHFSKEYKSDFNYLNINNFNPNKIESTTKLLTSISSIIQVDTNANQGQIPHYLKKHKCLPLWVLMRKLNFGAVSYFYACMTSKIRKEVANEILNDYKKEYPNSNLTYPTFESELEYILKFINRFRNVCAHEDRLFNLKYNIPRITLPYMTIISPFTSRLYDLLVLLKLFLTKQDFQSLVKQVEEEWSNLSKYLAQNVLNEVMIKSGFPKNWKQRL